MIIPGLLTVGILCVARGVTPYLNVLKGGLRMKLKLLAFVFILAFAITSFGALGAGGASANTPELTIIPADTTVVGPAEATGGAITAFTNVSDHTTIDAIDVSFDGTH